MDKEQTEKGEEKRKMKERLKVGRKQKLEVIRGKESKRNNTNSIGSDNSSVINISSSNNKFLVGGRWNNK